MERGSQIRGIRKQYDKGALDPKLRLGIQPGKLRLPESGLGCAAGAVKGAGVQVQRIAEANRGCKTREAGASRTASPSGSLGTSEKPG
jgi:hypothetical protein